MQISILDSPLNDSMIARRLEILETATADQGSFEPQPPLTMWQVRRVSAIEDHWFAMPTWDALYAQCKRLIPDWREVDDLTADFLTRFLDAAKYFYAAGWQAAAALQGYPEGIAGLWSAPHDTRYAEAQRMWSQTDTQRAVSDWEAEWLPRWSRLTGDYAAAADIMMRRRTAERDLGRALFREAWLDYAALAGTPASVPIASVQGRAH